MQKLTCRQVNTVNFPSTKLNSFHTKVNNIHRKIELAHIFDMRITID